MQSIRRFYFYLITFISLEVVIWGAILLARTLISPLPIRSVSTLLASGLSLVLVGLPIFLLHWVTAQRDALHNEEERITRVRAIFLYGARLAVLIPVAQNVLAILDRLLLQLMNAPVTAAFLGSGQSLADNLVAIAINIVAWAYLERVLRGDRETWLENNHLDEACRLYRYIWFVYALVLTVMGVQQVLHFLLTIPLVDELQMAAEAIWLANGTALALVGAPVWAWIWRLVHLSMTPDERSTPLHLAVVYLTALFGAIIFVISISSFLSSLLSYVINPGMSATTLISRNATTLSLAIPMAVLWIYFGRERQRSVRAESDALQRAELDRLYFYLLALTGNVAVFTGLWQLLVSLAALAAPVQNLTRGGVL